MDYGTLLREAAESSHAIFHIFMLTISKARPNEQYLFFEGDDDPLFYVHQAQVFLGNRDYHEFVCKGRDAVLKVHDLIARDNRAIERTHFFVDKDHNDVMRGETEFSGSIFRTCCYSFENYMVCERVLRRFWVERLHLPSTDQRLGQTITAFKAMHNCLMRRMRVLMALVLIGRGIEGGPQIKLNLNNVNLDKLFKLDFSRSHVGWQPQAMRNFLAASNMTEAGVGAIRLAQVKQICRNYLSTPDAKCYVRGKYELWFFVKFLMAKTRELADRKAAVAVGMPRARPKESITHTNCIIQLAPLCPCPQDLTKYLRERLGAPQV